MANQYYRFLEILKRWPVEEPRTTYCFGKYLRDLSPKWFTSDGRVIGSPEDCDQRLKSLEILASDYYRQKYPTPRLKTVTGMTVGECTKTLVEDFGESKGIVKNILSKFSFKLFKRD